ncbi:MAG TPA: hypothetical protein DCG39_11875 [Opitutae bacterium]|nr:hypothetical protein [Opitutae bacterium]
MKTLLAFTLLAITSVSVWAADDALHSWTDLQGRTLQASFVKADATTVTIKWNGKVVPIPLATLSPASQALAGRLSRAASPSAAGMHSWTDTQGRTLQAVFLKSDGVTVALNWNGRVVPIPLATLSPASQKLARELASAKATPSKPSEPSSPSPPTLEPTPAEGELSLDAEHNWASTDGNVIKAKFLSLEGEDLNLGLFGGRRESSVPLSRLSPDSQALAKKLHGIYKEKEKKAIQAAKKRKSMKVPDLADNSLDDMHMWKSSDGNAIEAMFVAADESVLTLVMKQNPSRPYEIPWNRLDEPSQALGEGLRRLKEKLMPKNPRIIPAKGGRLASYGEGKWKGYNTVLESAIYDVALSSSGHTVNIWLKEFGSNKNAGDGDRATERPLQVHFRATYWLKNDGKRRVRKYRKVVSFESSPEVSMDREETTLKGTYDNNSTFEYTMEINHRGLSFWGKMKESSGEEHPTVFSIVMQTPNIAPEATKEGLTLAAIKEIVGTGALYVDPLEAKRIKLPMAEKWDDLRKEYNGRTANPIKTAELNGKPFGSHKIMLAPTNVKGMHFHWGKGYSGMFPFQSIYLSYRTEEAMKAIESYGEGKVDSDRLIIPKNKRLNVKIIRGRG